MLRVFLLVYLLVITLETHLPVGVTDTGMCDGSRADVSRGDLQFSAQLERGVAGSQDVLEICVNLTNVGSEPVWVFANVSAGVDTGLLDGAGGRVSFKGVHSCHALFPRPPYPDDLFVLLSPGESCNDYTLLPLGSYEVVGPGSYAVVVWYRSPIWAKYGPQAGRFWSRDDGDLELMALPIVIAAG
jgi:hypothetical protein